MIATRDEILAELRLAPLWRRRSEAGLANAAHVAVEETSHVEETPPIAASETTHVALEETSHVALEETSHVVEERSQGAVEEASTERAALLQADHSVAQPDAAYSAAAPLAHSSTAVVDENARLARIGSLEWADFATDVASCTACALCRNRKKTVPGVGDARAEWLFVGEAPGAEEDAIGEPFVGQAGRLLDSMLAAVKLARGRNVYIANVQKCRPPGNRTPEPTEIEACRPYLDRQIALIRPKLIVALGRSAATTLLGYDATIGSLRGRVHRYRNVPLVVTYHPAYLLRTLPDKAKAWEDLLLARRTMQSAGADRPLAGPAGVG